MDIYLIEIPEKLIDRLEDLYSARTYIFRGQPNSSYKLIPSRFRDIAQDKFPIEENEIKKWFLDEKLINHLQLSLGPGVFTFKQGLHPQILRHFELFIHIMKYYYFLYDYYENNPERVSKKDERMIAMYHKDHWKKKETFILNFASRLDEYYPTISTKGEILEEGHSSEAYGHIDATLAQHYGVPTPALDWTYNPYVALCFALGKECMNESKSLYIAKEIKTHFAIHAYRQISDEKESPVFKRDKDKNISNLRAERQEGTFTYFSKPCQFYLENGRFPSIEDYDKESNKDFEMIKFSMPYNMSTRDYFIKILEKEGINEDFLYPDREKNSSCF